MHDQQGQSPRPKIGSLFSGYGGLDFAVEHVLNADTVWFSELNKPVASVFARHWPDIPNLGDITVINWRAVEPVDILIGGFPCQNVSIVGKRTGLAPGTRSGPWAHMALPINAFQPEWVVIENVRGLLSSPANLPPTGRKPDEPRNLAHATPDDATPRELEPNPWNLGDNAARPLRALGAVLGDLADLRLDARWIGLPASLVGAPHHRFRTPLATDSSRGGGETLDQVRARHGTIALSHQIIDFALHGPYGSPTKRRESETLWSLIDGLFNAGDTPTPSPDGNTSPNEQRRPQPF